MPQVVTVKLTAAEEEALDLVVELGNFRSRSHLIRTALVREFLRYELRPALMAELRLQRLGKVNRRMR